ncbi:MAG: hypothetical protein HYY65_11890 [Candidatus Tectomicrobia bacterium]|uniref:Uncharacterized protein n=1 Tax=Tectimicrobiota bacterium TaxID=2528274 RepID=A0A932M1P4_UNCTE|nr:hypothetical protein [Candidatus Tectomicrobia bacterium]
MMSRVFVKSTAPKQPTMVNLATLAPRLLAMSVDSARVFMQQAAGILSPAMPAWSALKPKGMCEIPETECPPRCACEIAWEAGRGETLRCTIRVTNASQTGRTFTFQATPFVGAGGSSATIALSPTNLTLPAGQSGVVTATFTVPAGFTPGRYEAEILVQGAYEQCVCVTLEVQGEQHCACEVAQGDPPVRIRAHRWHDHFQCAEPCAPQPVGKPGMGKVVTEFATDTNPR